MSPLRTLHLALSSVIVFACSPNFNTNGEATSNVAIVGGNTRDFDFLKASTVSLTYEKVDGNKVHMCTGTLIGPNQVITAAHCLIEKLHPEKISVQINTDGQVATFKPTGFAINPKFEGMWNFDASYDLALIAFNSSTPGGLDSFVELSRSQPDPNGKAFIAGYGFTSSSSSATYGMFNGALAKIETLKPRSFTLSPNGVGICSGDSGGPLYQHDQQHRLTLTGVASSSDECDLGGGEFSRIDTGYKWISCSFSKSGMALPYGQSKGELPISICSELVNEKSLAQQNTARCRAYKHDWELLEKVNGSSHCWPATQSACEALSRETGGDVYWGENACQVRD